MHRVLKPTGSIYLHCDPTASHYLKMQMDSIYATRNFRSEITWRRANAKGLAFKGYPNNADILLYYSLSDEFTWNRPFLPHDPEYVEKFYSRIEPETGRRYRLGDLIRYRPDRHPPPDGHRRPYQLPAEQTHPVRTARGSLQRLQGRLPVQAVRCRPPCASLSGRHGSLGKPATALIKLQPHQGQPASPVPRGAAGRDWGLTNRH